MHLLKKVFKNAFKHKLFSSKWIKWFCYSVKITHHHSNCRLFSTHSCFILHFDVTYIIMDLCLTHRDLFSIVKLCQWNLDFYFLLSMFWNHTCIILLYTFHFHQFTNTTDRNLFSKGIFESVLYIVYRQ